MQGFDYALPDVRKMMSAHVLIADGQVVQALLAKPTVEMYFLSDPEWRNPAWRLQGLTKLHEVVRLDLNGKGIEQVHAWLPPQIADSFGQRLVRDFGWEKSPWPCYERPTKAIL